MSYTKLLQPKINPFGIYIYSPKDETITLKSFSDKIISSYELNKYKEQGAYCNSFTDLFISEGKYFWVISNSSFSIKKKKTPIEKNNHSMLFLSFVTDSSKVFLIGGSDKKAFYYDLKKNYFLNWAETNEFHIRPALMKIDDYLYIFDGLKQSKICFERTNLTENIKKWEKIVPNFDRKIISYFPSKNFATALDSKGAVIFLGGDNINMENNNTFIYNTKNNAISLSLNGTNDSTIFYDKTFYKINNKNSVALPHRINENSEISYVDKDEQSLIKVSVSINVSVKQSVNDIESNVQYRNNNNNYMYKNNYNIQERNYSNYNNNNDDNDDEVGVCHYCQNSYRSNKYNRGNINNNINDNFQSNIHYNKYSQYSQPRQTKIKLEGNNVKNQSNNRNTNFVIKEEPQEFGYYISSSSTDESKLKAKKFGVKVVPSSKKYEKYVAPIKIKQTYDRIDKKQIIIGQNKQKEVIFKDESSYVESKYSHVQKSYSNQQYGIDNESQKKQDNKSSIEKSQNTQNYNQYQNQKINQENDINYKSNIELNKEQNIQNNYNEIVDENNYKEDNQKVEQKKTEQEKYQYKNSQQEKQYIEEEQYQQGGEEQEQQGGEQ